MRATQCRTRVSTLTPACVPSNPYRRPSAASDVSVPLVLSRSRPVWLFVLAACGERPAAPSLAAPPAHPTRSGRRPRARRATAACGRGPRLENPWQKAPRVASQVKVDENGVTAIVPATCCINGDIRAQLEAAVGWVRRWPRSASTEPVRRSSPFCVRRGSSRAARWSAPRPAPCRDANRAAEPQRRERVAVGAGGRDRAGPADPAARRSALSRRGACIPLAATVRQINSVTPMTADSPGCRRAQVSRPGRWCSRRMPVSTAASLSVVWGSLMSGSSLEPDQGSARKCRSSCRVNC